MHRVFTERRSSLGRLKTKGVLHLNFFIERVLYETTIKASTFSQDYLTQGHQIKRFFYVSVSETVVRGGSPGGPQAVSEEKSSAEIVSDSERMKNVC
jgi:hypothetical protein